jgi:hypothetical protein
MSLPYFAHGLPALDSAPYLAARISRVTRPSGLRRKTVGRGQRPEQALENPEGSRQSERAEHSIARKAAQT